MRVGLRNGHGERDESVHMLLHVENSAIDDF